jgi:predicted nuclease of predicted toxin-antitoxin system
MLRLVSDENFSGRIVRGLTARVAGLDLVRVQDAGLMQTPDPQVLAWAAAEGRVVLTHDRRTMPPFAYDRVRAGEPMPGVVVVSHLIPVGQAIDELELLLTCTSADELRDRVEYIPL